MEDRRLRRIELASQRMTVALLAFLSLIALGTVLSSGRSVVIPLVLAMLASNIFIPFVRRGARKGIPPFLTVFVFLVLFVGVCLMALIFVNARVIALAQAFPRYYARLLALAQSLANTYDLPVNFWEGLNLGDKATAYLFNLSGSAVSFLSNLILVMVFMVFILLGSPYFEYKIRKAFSSNNAGRVQLVMEKISLQISRYLVTQTLISAATGILVWFFLAFFIGVDFPITWGILAFFLNFIPTLGSIIASLPPVLMALVQHAPDIWPAAGVALVLAAIQMTLGNFIAPKIYGERLNLSPVVILLFLLFWGWLWGITGALLAVPIAAAIQIALAHIPSLAPLAILMGSGKRYTRKPTPAAEP